MKYEIHKGALQKPLAPGHLSRKDELFMECVGVNLTIHPADFHLVRMDIKE